jgi:hypothetical protein
MSLVVVASCSNVNHSHGKTNYNKITNVQVNSFSKSNMIERHRRRRVYKISSYLFCKDRRTKVSCDRKKLFWWFMEIERNVYWEELHDFGFQILTYQCTVLLGFYCAILFLSFLITLGSEIWHWRIQRIFLTILIKLVYYYFKIEFESKIFYSIYHNKKK